MDRSVSSGPAKGPPHCAGGAAGVPDTAGTKPAAEVSQGRVTERKAAQAKAGEGRTQDGRSVRVLDRADLLSLVDGSKPGLVLLGLSAARQAAAKEVAKHLQLYRAAIARPLEPAHPADQARAQVDLMSVLSQWPSIHLSNLSEALTRFLDGSSFYDSRVPVLRQLQREVDEEVSRLAGPACTELPELSLSAVSKEDSCEGHSVSGTVPPPETKSGPGPGALVRSGQFYYAGSRATVSPPPPPVAWSQPVPPVDCLRLQGLAFDVVGRKPLDGEGRHLVLALTVIVDGRPVAGVFKRFDGEPRDAAFHARTGIDPEAPAWLDRALAAHAVDQLIRTGLVPRARIATLEMDGAPCTGLLMDRAVASSAPLDTGDGRLRMLLTRLRWMDLLNGEAARGPHDWMAGRDASSRWQVAALSKGSGFGCRLTVEDGATPVPAHIDVGLRDRLLRLTPGHLHSALSPLLDGLEVIGQCSRLEDIQRLLETPGRVSALAEDEEAWAQLPGPRAASSTTTMSSSSSPPGKPAS